jgi:hypothetical protein
MRGLRQGYARPRGCGERRSGKCTHFPGRTSRRSGCRLHWCANGGHSGIVTCAIAQVFPTLARKIRKGLRFFPEMPCRTQSKQETRMRPSPRSTSLSLGSGRDWFQSLEKAAVWSHRSGGSSSGIHSFRLRRRRKTARRKTQEKRALRFIVGLEVVNMDATVHSFSLERKNAYEIADSGLASCVLKSFQVLFWRKNGARRIYCARRLRPSV